MGSLGRISGGIWSGFAAVRRGVFRTITLRLPVANLWRGGEVSGSGSRFGRATIRVMARLNLTLEERTLHRLEERASDLGRARAAVARELLIGALDRLERRERQEQLARDYAAGRDDAVRILAEMEAGQLDLLDD